MTHEYWRNVVSRRLAALGFQVTPDFDLGEGTKIDLRAEKGGKIVYIEVETGKANVAANIEKCSELDGAVLFFFTLASLAEEYRQSLAWIGARAISPETIEELDSLA
jgi:hypothetical protein